MSAFERLHRNIQHILYDMKWEKLHTFQADAIHAWFDSTDDLMIMASTASGKTEAAFLPILSSIASQQNSNSIRALLISPLKALINDQFRRLDDLCVRAEIPVHRWHGDVSVSHKNKLLKKPSGVLLITPESMESLFVNYSRNLNNLFHQLEVCVIDEMHVFIDSERGRQVLSQLARIDALRNGKESIRRVGLSATIGDVNKAGNWLCGPGKLPRIIKSDMANDVELVLKSFVQETVNEDSGADIELARELIEKFSNNTNLVFCNSKLEIELLADTIASLCRTSNRENRFMVHHGSVSKIIREDTEEQLKSARACSAICSSTLELGIDIGNIDSVVQIGPAHSVSSLKQRLGRSGRKKGQASVLHFYIPVIKLGEKASVFDHLYLDLIQALALVKTLANPEGWVEPPKPNIIDYSTLIQQILSLIKQKGAANAFEIYQVLCATKPYETITTEIFSVLLKDLGKADLIEQISDGKLILGMEGEIIANRYDFYVAFETNRDYSVISDRGLIGTIEGKPGYYVTGDFIVLAGKRWKIVQVDDNSQRIDVKLARGKKLVKWSGEPGKVHRKIREDMYSILNGDSFDWLEKHSTMLLQEAQSYFSHQRLSHNRILQQGDTVNLFTWTSTEGNFVIKLILSLVGIPISGITDEGAGLSISSISEKEVRNALLQFYRKPLTAEQLVQSVYKDEIPPTGKYGHYLSKPFRLEMFASTHFNINDALNSIKGIVRY